MIDTYEELKQETTAKPEDGHGGHHGDRKDSQSQNNGGDSAVQNIMRMASMVNADNPYLKGDNPGGAASDDRGGQGPNENRPLSHFFGELEIKGLINVSFYAFYCQVDLNLQLG